MSASVHVYGLQLADGLKVLGRAPKLFAKLTTSRAPDRFTGVRAAAWQRNLSSVVGHLSWPKRQWDRPFGMSDAQSEVQGLYVGRKRIQEPTHDAQRNPRDDLQASKSCVGLSPEDWKA